MINNNLVYSIILILGLLYSCSVKQDTASRDEVKNIVDSLCHYSEENGKDSSFYILLNHADLALEEYLNINAVDSFYLNCAYILANEESESNPKEVLDELYDLSILAKELDLNKLYGLIINSRATLLYKHGLYNEAIPLYLESSKIIKQYKDQHAYAYSLMDIGNIYYKQGMIELAIDYYELAKAEIDKFDDLEHKYYGLAVYENNLGLLAIDTENYDQAEKHFRIALSNRKIAGKENLYSHSYYYLARTKLIMGQTDSLMYYLYQAVQVDSSLNLIQERIHSTRNYAYYLAQVAKEPQRSFYYYQQALILSKEYQIEEYYALINLGIGGYYSRENQLDSAIYYGWRADSIAVVHSQKLAQRSALRFLRGIFTNNGDHYNLSKVLTKMMDLQEINGNNDGVMKVQIGYEFDQRKKEILLRENDRRRHQTNIILVLSISLLLLLFVVLLFRNRRKINRQSKELNRLLQAEKRLKLFQQDMTNMVVHDLKNPLSSIINIKYLDLDDDNINMIQQAGYQMNNLVMNVLDVYKYDSTQIEINIQETDIVDLIKGAFSQVEFLAQLKNISLALDEGVKCTVCLDNDTMIRVFVNLLSNAIKFSNTNGVIRIDLKKTKESEIRIGVFNNGPHIPYEQQEHIFERFVHSDSNSNSDITSTGLGLTFCKIAVEGHSGKIGVESKPDNDVEFWVTLPGLVDFTTK